MLRFRVGTSFAFLLGSLFLPYQYLLEKTGSCVLSEIKAQFDRTTAVRKAESHFPKLNAKQDLNCFHSSAGLVCLAPAAPAVADSGLEGTSYVLV